MRRQIDSSSHSLSWRKCHLWGPAMINTIMWLVHRLGAIHFHLNVRAHTHTRMHVHTLACTQKVERLCLLITVDILSAMLSSGFSKKYNSYASHIVAWLTKGCDTENSSVACWFAWPAPSEWSFFCVESVPCWSLDATGIICTVQFELLIECDCLSFLQIVADYYDFNHACFALTFFSYFLFLILHSKNVTIVWLLRPNKT